MGNNHAEAEAVANVISNDPPTAAGSGLESFVLGGFKVVKSEQHQIVYGSDADGLVCATITGPEYPSRVAIAMLQELYESFVGAGFIATSGGTGKYSLSKQAKPLMRQVCEKYADPSQVDKTQQLLQTVDVVKSQMQDNIVSLLENTTKAEDMAVKSDQLTEQAAVFKKRTAELKRQMQWKNIKMTIVFVVVIALLITAITVPLVQHGKKMIGK